MQKLTKTTWYRTIPQDLKLVFWLLGKAFISFLMFEIQDMRLILAVAWMTVRFEHEVMEDDE